LPGAGALPFASSFVFSGGAGLPVGLAAAFAGGFALAAGFAAGRTFGRTAGFGRATGRAFFFGLLALAGFVFLVAISSSVLSRSGRNAVVPVLGLVVHIAPVGATVRRVCAKVFTVETILAAIGSAAALALATNRMLLPR
jgi:hypothetical protein